MNRPEELDLKRPERETDLHVLSGEKSGQKSVPEREGDGQKPQGRKDQLKELKNDK